MGFQLGTPVTSRTTLWTPTKQPVLNGSQQVRNSGFGVQVSASQRREFVYRYSAKFRTFLFAFDGLTTVDQTNFEAFSDAASGDPFEVIDNQVGCGTLLSWTKVKFDVAGYERTWHPTAGQTWAVVVALREVD